AQAYDARLIEASRQVLADPNVTDHASEFTKRATKIYEDLNKQIGRRDVAHAFRVHSIREFGPRFSEVRGMSLRRQGERQVAMLDKHQTEAAKRVAEADDWALHPSDVDRVRNTFFEEVDRIVASGLISAVEGQKRKTVFEQDTVEKYMVRLAFSDPGKLRALESQGAFNAVDAYRRLQIHEQANEQEEENQGRQEKVLKQVQDIAENQLWSRAADGKITQSEIDAGLRGEGFLLKDAKKWRAIADANDNPILGGGGRETAIIMEEYYSQMSKPGMTIASSTRAIEQARAGLNKLREDLGRPSKVVGEALRRVQKDLEQLEAEQRTLGAQGRTLLTDERRRAVDEYDAKMWPLTGFEALDRLEEVHRAHERTLLRNMIDEGIPREEALQRVLDMATQRRGRKKPTSPKAPSSKPSAGEKPVKKSGKTLDELLEGALEEIR
ncbi:MAG: hypothetical protein ACRD2L_19660, partial [Terriglobia bacterium]